MERTALAPITVNMALNVQAIREVADAVIKDRETDAYQWAKSRSNEFRRRGDAGRVHFWEGVAVAIAQQLGLTSEPPYQ
jgi:hypothetical protein